MKKLMRMCLLATVMVAIVGCQTASQPGRTNSQVTTVKDNSQITVDNGEKLVLPAVVIPQIPAEGYSPTAFAQLQTLLKLQLEAQRSVDTGKGKGKTIGDVFTQNQMIENSGSEANNPTATSTPSVTTPIDVSWGNAASTAASGFMSGASALWNTLTGKGGNSTATAPKATGSTPACESGGCAPSGGCSDGSCSVGGR